MLTTVRNVSEKGMPDCEHAATEITVTDSFTVTLSGFVLQCCVYLVVHLFQSLKLCATHEGDSPVLVIHQIRAGADTECHELLMLRAAELTDVKTSSGNLQGRINCL